MLSRSASATPLVGLGSRLRPPDDKANMKNAFRAYYPPNEGELKDLWENGLIILDANALLVFFRYSASTREEFLRVLTDKKESLWLPHQVGLEFHRNRPKVVAEQKQAFERTIKFLTDLNTQAHDSFSKLNIRRHIALDVDALEKRLSKRIDKVAADVRRLQKAHRDSLRDGEDDKILDQIAELYEGKLGGPYSQEDLEKVYKDGRDRYAREQPPGYMDKDKGDPGMFGDLVLWLQILAKGTDSKQPAIFITDDLKEDWWLLVSGERKGPRPELIEEYMNASGNRIHFFTPESFLHFANTRGAMVSTETQDEVKEVSRAHALLPGLGTEDTRTLRELWIEANSPEAVRPDLSTEVLARRALMSQQRASLEEEQVELRQHRNLIEHRIATVDDDEVMRDEVLPKLLDQRALVDAQLSRVADELDALRHEGLGQERLIERNRHASELGLTLAGYAARENERRKRDLYRRLMSSDDERDPGHSGSGPRTIG
jgi:PIN like domain